MADTSGWLSRRCLQTHVKCLVFFFSSHANYQTDNMDPKEFATQNLKNNSYFFTFEARAFPEIEEFGHLGFIKPYFPGVDPEFPLGRPQSHSEDPATLLPIPKLLPQNCLEKDQYPWNILCSGPNGCKWDWKRHDHHQVLNVGAYQAEHKKQPPTDPYHLPPSSQSAMSTVTETALQTSYP